MPLDVVLVPRTKVKHDSMTGLIPQAFIEDLLVRIPIADVVSSRIQIKKSGSSLKACCPFHQEKTPSFHVNAQKNFYHCFGCGASGDSISFLREYEGLSFNDAVEELAKIAGLEVPRDEQVQAVYNQHQALWSGLEYACLRYREALSSHESREHAQQYLQKRGLSEEIVDRFAIGFAPAERNFLSRTAKPDALKALIRTKTVSDKYQNLFDLFQNRLMFPIRNLRGKTVAFGGRTLGDDKAKYINSPESEVFHKSSEVYGLFEANQANRQLDRLLVVEGYMDVVTLAQYGITYAVATLGTATNTESLSQLLRRCQRLVFCFDGDNAGIRAAQKAMENALPLFQDGMQLSFLLLPQGEDPDTLVREEGREAFEKRVDEAQPLSAFLFQIYSEGLDLNIAEQRGVLKQRAEGQIARVQSAVLKSALRQQLNAITFRRAGRGEFQEASAGKRDLVGHKVVRDPDVALCLALYYEPSRAVELLRHMESADVFPKTWEFADFLAANKIASTEDLVYLLAVDAAGNRDRFSDLFDRLEWVPNAEQAQSEADEVLLRLAREKKQVLALKAAKINKLPSQMTAEEKQALRSISIMAPSKTSK